MTTASVENIPQNIPETPLASDLSQPPILTNPKISDGATAVAEGLTGKLTDDPSPKEKKVPSKTASTRNNPASSPPLRLFTPQAPPHDALVSLTPQGEIGWRSPTEPIPDAIALCAEYPRNQQEQLILVTDSGKLTPLALAAIPPLAQPQPVLSLLSSAVQRGCDRLVAQFFMPETPTEEWLVLSASGRIKRLLTEEITDISPRGLSITKLKEGDRLQFWLPTQAKPELILATDGGRVLRFPLNNETVPVMSRSAQGNPILRLRSQEKLVGCLTVRNSDRLLLVSQLGYGKQLPISELRLGQVGDIGTQALRFTEVSDTLTGVLLVGASSRLLHLWTNRDRQISVPLTRIPLVNKDGQGAKIVNLEPGEVITQIYWA